jgi:membrane-associated protease RseP (regulator of RpoE activity)
MRLHRIIPVALALAFAAPVAAQAQEAQLFRYVQRGMLGIMTEGVPANSFTARQRVVVDVVKGSPADKAGVMKGDTVLRINGLAATSQVMTAPFEPGDTVTLRVKRDGRERDITVVAAERSHQFEALIADSIAGRMSIIFDEMRVNVDSLMPRMRVQRFGTDSTVTIIVGTDTIHTVGAMPGRVFEYSFGGEMPDSIRERLHVLPRMFGDSVMLRAFRRGEGGVYSIFADSMMGARPFDVMMSGAIIGVSAVAGAELYNLNADMGEYFGTPEGVLVMSARPGTPAERAGLRPGDVIKQVNGADVRNIGELRRAVESGRGAAVQLRVLRRGQNLDVTLGRS